MPTTPAAAAASGVRRPDGDDSRRVSILLGVLFGLAGMGSSSAAVALPILGPDLGVSTGLAAWTISLYVLMLAVTDRRVRPDLRPRRACGRRCWRGWC